MLKWLWRKLGTVGQKEIDLLNAENALLRVKVIMLERDIIRLCEENGALSEKIHEQQRVDSRAMKTMLEELDLLFLETLKPVGDA